MVDFINYLSEADIEPNPIIIDADDLQNNPGSILRQYCETVDIPYSAKLLQWESGDDIVKKRWLASKTLLAGNEIANYYEAAFASTGFQVAKKPSTDIPEDIVELIENMTPFYNKLYERRLKP